MKRLLALSVLALAIAASPAYAILNGVPDGDDHPYVGMVTWEAPNDLTFVCSGTKISEHRFLTAGHCFPQGSSVEIVFGENGHDRKQLYTGEFVRSFIGDVAIVKVDQVMPPPYARLPGDDYSVARLPMRQLVTSVGYGMRVPLKDFAGEAYQRYRATSELIQANGALSPQYIKLSANPAQGKGGVCFGDSGGPTLIDGDMIIGITSFGRNANCAGVTYAQRVDIPSVRAFIEAP